MPDKKKRKCKELLVSDEGIDAIALVEFPAIEIDFQYFATEKMNVTFAKADMEKHILTGPAMVPDKLIYRYDPLTNEEYDVWFSKETVKQISEKYLLEGKQSSTNIEHEVPINDVTIVESWIVEDPSKDKAAVLGYDVPVGTWMVSMKVNNDEVWNNLVKEGEVKGFSIEGSFVEKFAKSKFTAMNLIDGSTINFDRLEIGGIVELPTSAEAIRTLELEDHRLLKVDRNGKILNIIDPNETVDTMPEGKTEKILEIIKELVEKLD